MTGIVIVDHGSRQKESNQKFEEIVQRFTQLHDHKIVEPAHMEIASPSIQEAFDSAVGKGATDIVVLPYFLLPGRHWHNDIPELCARAASRHPGLTWHVTEPLGMSDKILEVVAERLAGHTK
ncbi:MAG: sirohydrochlorin cobaltochelatase [Planctomycetota bacterium]|nr:sirohydrochlorin cobaltochelatase [Planctomycetota bacterium]MDA1140526.1 sirohydrochlorin cobaltochelatase [Planctomycetota bacterium]